MLTLLPFFEDEERGTNDHGKADKVVPADAFFKIEDGKGTKNSESDDFLNGF